MRKFNFVMVNFTRFGTFNTIKSQCANFHKHHIHLSTNFSSMFSKNKFINFVISSSQITHKKLFTFSFNLLLCSIKKTTLLFLFRKSAIKTLFVRKTDETNEHKSPELFAHSVSHSCYTQ